MRILFIGDIVGRPGKHACSQIVPLLRREREIECVIANAENTAAGSGLTPPMFKKLLHYGIDACTMGDHIYRRREIFPLLESSERIVRPANFVPEATGHDLAIFETQNATRVALISLLGRIFMNVRSECPFHAVDRVLRRVPQDVKIILVDMHAETTSEKIAMGWHLDGRVTAVVGTHTHVQTADERVLPKGTAYITDLGMTGPYDSILGRDKHRVLQVLTTGMPTPYNVAENDVRLCGVIIEANSSTGRAIAIERVCVHDESELPPEDGTDDEHGR